MDRIKRERSRSRSRSRDRSRGRDHSRDRDKFASSRNADRRIYVSNIPYESRWQEIKDLFRKEVGEVSYVELFNDENEKPRGCGIIEFDSPATAKKAIEKMHRYDLSGRKIVVKEDFDVERDKYGKIIPKKERSERDRDRSREVTRIERDWMERRRDPSPEDSGGSWVYGNTYGLSTQFLQSLGIEGKLIPKVFLSNLDYRVDEKKLKEVFRFAGRVLAVEIAKDRDGKSRGHGTIEFEHPVEAVQAISMFNNQQLYDRRMHVKMDRLSDPIADLENNRLPEGLKGIGMGLGVNGQPLVDVARNLPSANPTSTSATATTTGSTASSNGQSNTPSTGTTQASTLPNALSALAAVNQLGNLASIINPQALESLQQLAVPAAAASNPFGALANSLNQNAGNTVLNSLTNAASGLGTGLAAALQGATGNVPPNSIPQAQPSSLNLLSGSGTSALGGNSAPSGFNSTTSNQAGGSANTFRDTEYGYTSTPNFSNSGANAGGGYNSPLNREKGSYGNGIVGMTSTGTSFLSQVGGSSNTCIVSNLPQNCTWQGLKSKFRECGDVVFAEMRDKNTGIVRFAMERDADRAVKVFDKSRVDGRIIDVHLL